MDEFDLADMKNKEKSDRMKDESLTFVEVAKNTYRILNKKTGRFHNLELRIDEVL